MVIVVASENSKYPIEFLAKGKQKLQEFPLLTKYVDSFKNFSKKSYDYNIFLNLSVRANQEGQKSYPQALLEQIETVLDVVEKANLKKQVKNSIKKRMQKFEYDGTLSIYRELSFYSELLRTPEIKKPTYESFNDSHHDFGFSIERIPFNLELTGLEEGDAPKELRLGFHEAAKKLLAQIKANKCLRATIRTDILRDSNEKMDKAHIEKVLLRGINKIFPIITVKPGWFHLRGFGNPDKNLWAYKETFEHYSELGERLNELGKSKRGVKYLKATKEKILSGNCVVSASYFPATHRVVEIQSEFVFPSYTQSMREKYLLGQLSRRIIKKIDKGQLKGKQNPIISVQFNDTLFKGYTDSSLFEVEKYLKILKETIENAFKQKSELEILGVLLWEQQFSKSIFFPNPNIKIKKPVLGKIRKVWQEATRLKKFFQKKNAPKQVNLAEKHILKTRKRKIEGEIKGRIRKSIIRVLFNKRKFDTSRDSSIDFIKLGNSHLAGKEWFVRMPRYTKYDWEGLPKLYSGPIEEGEINLVITKIIAAVKNENILSKTVVDKNPQAAEVFGELLDEALSKKPDANLIITNIHDYHKFFWLDRNKFKFDYGNNQRYVRGTYNGIKLFDSRIVPPGKTIVLNAAKIGDFIIKKDINATLAEIPSADRPKIKETLQLSDADLDKKVRLLIEEVIQFVVKDPNAAIIIETEKCQKA